MISRLHLVTTFEAPYYGVQRALARTNSSGTEWCEFEEGKHGATLGVFVKMTAGQKSYRFFFPWTAILAAEVEGK